MPEEKNKTSQVTTISFIKFSSVKAKIWAFGMMRNAHMYLSDLQGMSFYKLMGSGRGSGFGPLPDWSVYSLLQVWDDEKYSLEFQDKSELPALYQTHGSEMITFYLKNISSHGKWSNAEPFRLSGSVDSERGPVAVITRATIKNEHLFRFWKYVPVAAKPIPRAKELIFRKGIGEVPVKQMATFSIWKNTEAVRKYAYSSPEHSRAISLTRKFNWFSEELFARFQLYKILGNWENISFGIKS